jgi:succinoglycan biosynthesis protein ExoO
MTTNTMAALMPLYNKEPYVARAITSVLAQTRPVDEIIVVDDASTDGSLEQLKTFRDPRMRVLRRTDSSERGPAATRNVGIRSATSRWIALLDADDAWHEDYIEENHRLIAKASDRTGLLFTGWQSIGPDGVIARDRYSARCDDQGFSRLDLDGFVSAWLDVGACPVLPSAVVLRRDTLLQAGLFDERCRRGEDKEMWLRIMTIADALSSPRVCSSYYHNIPGAVNYTMTTNMRHCLCATLEQMIAQAWGPRRRLLMRLFNHQVLEYARWVGGRERLSPEVYRGFFASIDPQSYVLLLALSYLPIPAQQLMRKCMLWARRVVGKPTSWE